MTTYAEQVRAARYEVDWVISLDDGELEAVAEAHDQLVDGSFYPRQEAAIAALGGTVRYIGEAPMPR